MRVLHIVAEPEGSVDARAAAESLIASMASLDARVEVAEVGLSAEVLDAVPAAGASGAVLPAGGAGLLAEIMAADLLVLSVPGTGAVPPGVRRLADLLRGPQARLLRAADRRSGHRVTRRLVVVATQGGPMVELHGADADAPLGPLLALVRDAFRTVDVSEVGLITGAPARASAPGPPDGAMRSGARAWLGRGVRWERAQAS